MGGNLLEKFNKQSLIAFIIGPLFWLLDALIQAYLFKEGSFMQQLFLPKPLELWLRLFIVIISVIFGFIFLEHCRTENTLRQNEQKYRMLIEKTNQAIALIDTNRKQQETDKAAEEKAAEDRKSSEESVLRMQEQLRDKEEKLIEKEAALEAGRESLRDKEEKFALAEKSLQERKERLNAWQEALHKKEEELRAQEVNLEGSQNQAKAKVEDSAKPEEQKELREESLHEQDSAIKAQEEYIYKHTRELDAKETVLREKEEQLKVIAAALYQREELIKSCEGSFHKQKEDLQAKEELLRQQEESFTVQEGSFCEKERIFQEKELSLQEREEQLKLTEESLRQKEAQLKQPSVSGQLLFMQPQILQASRLAAIGQFASGLAIEINSPLTNILNNVAQCKTEMQENAQLRTDDVRSLLGAVEESALKCKTIIQSLSGFFRAQAQTFQPVSLNEMINKMSMLVENRLRLQSITIKKQLHQNLPQVMGDASLLQLAIFNLISNAKWAIQKKSPKEGGTISITTQYNAEDKRIRLIIQDTGIGMSKESLEHIFEHFSTDIPQGEEVGFELMFVQSIINDHQGTIEVESAPQEGSIFKISFPALDEAA